MTRRSLLASTFGVLIAPSLGFAKADPDEAEIARVKKIAETAGIADFGVSKNDQYLAIGNASKDGRAECLRMLLSLSGDYMRHFGDKGFSLKKPAGRMTVIILSDRRSFAKYLGEDANEAVAGTYDPAANDLLMFDNRTAKVDPAGAKITTMVLTHEAVHQLTFNTGMLSRNGDVPKAIAEGLANYAEVRSLDGKTKIGAINDRRLIGYLASFNGKPPTPSPVELLIRDDVRIDAKETELEAYSEAWLLVHYLMKTKTRLPQFLEYLKAIQGRESPENRMADWTKHMGDLKTFDRDLTSYLRKIAK